MLRSPDQGRTWSDDELFYSWRNITPYEARICEMQPGRLVVILWAYDAATDRNLPNQVTFSTDNGRSWSEPENTGHMAQSSSLVWLGGDFLASIHAHRGSDPGLYVRLVDFSKNRWKVVEERVIWGPIRRLSEPGRPADGRHVRILEVWTAFFVASDRQRISRLSLERRGGPRQNTRASAQNSNLIRFV